MKVRSTLLFLLSALLISNVVATAGDKTRKPHIELWIFNDLMFIDFFGGLASGFYGKDVLSTWEGCADGFPAIWDAVLNEINSIDWSDLFNWTKDWEELQGSWQFAVALVAGSANEVWQCKGIVSEIEEAVKFIVHHIGIA